MNTRVTLLTDTDFCDMPWKNGGGTTRELFRLAHPRRTDAFALRLSIAWVEQGGPFSLFSGIDRTLMVLHGDGMALRVDGGDEIILDRPLVPFSFLGDALVDCRLLGGPLRDFNVMVARDWGGVHTEVVEAPKNAVVSGMPGPMRLIYVVSGRAQCDHHMAASGELLHIPAGLTATVRALSDSVLIVAAVGAV